MLCRQYILCLFVLNVPCQLRGTFVFIPKGLFCCNWKCQQSLKMRSKSSETLINHSPCPALQKEAFTVRNWKKLWRLILCDAKLLLSWLPQWKERTFKNMLYGNKPGTTWYLYGSFPLVDSCFTDCLSAWFPHLWGWRCIGWVISVLQLLAFLGSQEEKESCPFPRLPQFSVSLSGFLTFITKCGWQQG